MKLKTNVNKPELANVEHQGNFKIKSSAKAFAILSSGLYSNKIKAIVRELSCNAVDSHVEAGKADIPFDVHLPNAIEPYFSVRDYGIGLDHEGVTQLYTTYFESTKTESNDYIGALGLGSKSPFSYTENFTVTAIKDGMKRVYTAYIDDTGCPSIALMYEGEVEELTENTEEGLIDVLSGSNGVEVKFPVNEQHDYNRFTEEAHEVFTWFNVKPNVTGNSYYSHREPEYEREDIIPGVHLKVNSGYRNSPIAVQGNIAYKINFTLPESHAHLSHLFGMPFVMHFNLGELDVSASREDLSYIDMTVDNILNKMNEVNDRLYEYFVEQMSEYEEGYEKAQALYDFEKSKAFTESARKYVKDGNCALLQCTGDGYGYGLTSNLTFDADQLKALGVELHWMHFSRTYRSSAYSYVARDQRMECDYNTERRWYTIPVRRQPVFLVNDEKAGPITRIKDHYRTNSHGDTDVILIKPLDDAPDDAVNTFIKSVYNPPLTKVSELDKRDREKSFRAGFLYLDYVDISKVWYSNEKEYRYQRITHEFEQDPNKTYYYFPIKGFHPDCGNGNTFDMHDVWKEVISVGFFNREDSIYGVRKSQIKNIEGLSNWINLFDYLKGQIENYDKTEIVHALYRDALNDCITEPFLRDHAISELDNDSTFKCFMKDVKYAFDNSSSSALSRLKSLSRIARTLKCEFEFNRDEQISKIREDYNGIMDKYPMVSLALSNGTPSTNDSVQIVNYVNIIDTMESKDGA